MASVAHFTNFKNSNTSNSKIPEYAKDFRKEWLYIRGINKKCGEFSKKLNNTTEHEEVFWSFKPKALIKDFKNVLEAQKVGKFQNISKLKFKLSAVEEIIKLRLDLYYIIGYILNADFIMGDDEFQDFFENFIIFTNSTNIKYEENFEDDTFDINDYRGSYTENDSDSGSGIDIDSDIFDTDSESDSESD